MSAAIRRSEAAELNDAWAIVTEYYEAIGVVEREGPEAFAANYFGEGTGIWLARIGDEVAGCIALRRLDDGSAEVKRLYVRPAWQGRRVAHLLLDALHEFARDARYRWLYLDSKDDLAVAIRFYRSRGYEDCPRYNDNPQATVFLRRSVQP